jgi:hypothetical protein
MVKNKMIIIRITEEQNKELIAIAKRNGFNKKSDYVRSLLFANMSLQDKVDKIFDKVCGNG